jgi:hypothetical protein
MSDKQKRLEYNRRAAEMNGRYQMQRYPGMIQGVEIPAMGTQGGIGIISVVDAVNDSMSPEQRYCPTPGSLLVGDKIVQTPGELRGLGSIMAPNARNQVSAKRDMTIVPKSGKTRRYNLKELLG